MGKTSNEVKRRYNEKNYKQINVALRFEDVEQLEKYCKATGDSKRGFFSRMIKEHARVEADKENK